MTTNANFYILFSSFRVDMFVRVKHYIHAHFLCEHVINIPRYRKKLNLLRVHPEIALTFIHTQIASWPPDTSHLPTPSHERIDTHKIFVPMLCGAWGLAGSRLSCNRFRSEAYEMNQRVEESTHGKKTSTDILTCQ